MTSDLLEFQPSTTELPPAVTPQLGVEGGTYSSGGSLALYDSMSSAKIYSTTDGTTPTANSRLYTSTLNIVSTVTVKAIAIAPGYRDSGVISASYTILPQAATPTFSEPGGSYSSAQTVKISDTTPGATILYTTDGVTVLKYTGPIVISKTTTLSSVAQANVTPRARWPRRLIRSLRSRVASRAGRRRERRLRAGRRRENRRVQIGRAHV